MKNRPAIVRLHEAELNGEALISITLAWHDAEYTGEAVGSADWSSRPRLVGEATLRAVEAVTDHRVSLTLAAVASSDLGSAHIAVAQVKMEGASEPLVGSALIAESNQSAATVKAVLDALNRRLSQVL